MTYSADEARHELLDAIAEAIAELATSIAAFGDAYEQLDETAGDRLEEELFRPVQQAYGRAQRTHAGFAERFGLPKATFPAPGGGSGGHHPRELIDDGVDAAIAADDLLATLQDSMRPVEVGDPELRAGLAEVRELIGPVPRRADSFISTLGR